MQRPFSEAGLELRRPANLVGQLPKVKTMPAPNGRTDIATVEEIRRTRDW